MPPGLYIHVPFCRTRCHYCAFYLRIYRPDLAQAYIDALLAEIRLHAMQGTLRKTPPATVYFGGGTPTLLPIETLTYVLEIIHKNFGLAADAEITIEATPDSVNEESLSALRAAGFNRLSLGMESSHSGELLVIGRRGLSDPVAVSTTMARRAGFSNLNLDLIYGLPGQTVASWQASLDQALALKPTHLSIYALSVEAGSRFHVDRRRGDLPELDEELALAQESLAAIHLLEQGFERYEISNYARPGYHCRHNRLYWEAGEYLGLGPSAQSYLAGRRFGVISDLNRYCTLLASGVLPIEEEQVLDSARQGREAVVFGLRLTAGVDLASWPAREAALSMQPILAKLKTEGMLEQEGSRLRLTELGRRYADTVALALL